MTKVFDDVELVWQGEKYRIPGDQMMIAIARIEDHITLKELMEGMSTGKPKIASIARAYATVLRLAGARVDDAEVYGGMFAPPAQSADGSDGDERTLAMEAISGLLQMMVPPDAFRTKTVTVAKTGESERRPQSREAAASSSQKRTRRHTAGA